MKVEEKYIPFTTNADFYRYYFNTPAGLNGGSECESDTTQGGGVRFMNFAGCGVPFTSVTNISNDK
jgi:hypothetical protein